ncbi:hypothetical protein RYH80_15755 [Halobaculum sp. MBLA0147]|uniref:hypothetical protein n=1 Tax=Halobaculum sp. MBLA0147 TaxID=3079934 RepID=UPI00352548AE
MFQEVNVVNGTDRRIAGTVTVTGPDGGTVLDETFDLVSERQTQQGTATGTRTEPDAEVGVARYDDVFSATGTHTVAISLDEGSAVDGVREASTDVDVPDTEETNVVVAVGSGEESDEPIEITRLGQETQTESVTSE